ncbi:uncharacterized protein BDR25DRAFT_294397 [Lindgomyces ingoldianus]|uniref:Uncharacterized protein n=1 Tax=Lindgomyces ingoldianus TaxID=673940 RepID=A0ACB6QG43_9PLEO|nr:uncharacterized protein BDR25DRAFT_294397 [Lindgomyces ingoldianus]KAF2465857.1 hypothetical protein BDR25DRAFT_294397 [Lindgomyces ingoldianus]
MLFSDKFFLSSAFLLTVGDARPTDECSKSAIYVQTNANDHNSIVAIPIQSNGTLGAGVLHSTGGKGGNHLDSMTLQPVAPDGLLSQSAVAVAGNFLFATNAMTNSASMYRINPENATDLSLYGEYPVKGTFPNTVAASLKHNIACVATTGQTNGISCANFDERHGLGTFDALRPLGLNQSTPPVGPPNTVSQVAFTENEDFLVVTVKADPLTNKPGFVAVYRVEGKRVSHDAVRSSPAGTAILFGFDQIPHTNKFIVTDPSIGAAILNLNTKTSDVSTIKAINITGQAATCWTTISPATGTAFVTDGAVDRLVEIGLNDGGIVNIYDLIANGNSGLFDLRAVGEFLYVLAPGKGTTMPSVTVVKAKAGKVVQHLSLAGLGVTNNVQGMAFYR